MNHSDMSLSTHHLTQRQPCFHGCGTLLPSDSSTASHALRLAHLEHCPHASPLLRRAASLINEQRCELAARKES